VDAQLFRPRRKGLLTWPRPLWLYVGRLAVEKGVHDFLSLDLPGTKVLIGDGPARQRLEAQFPAARFLGFKHGDDLARHFAACDVFVFPSRTDTFGLVLLEAMASGLPVAAYPATGPLDVVLDGVSGALSEDLAAAALRCLQLDPWRCRQHALRYSWDNCTRQFIAMLATGRERDAAAAGPSM
jgi:glycosyltransferase involved in cell wall biosynthesis